MSIMPAKRVAPPKSVRVAFGAVGAMVLGLGATFGGLVAVVVALALLGMPLFAVLGGASELAWLTHADPEQRMLRRLAPEVFGMRFAGSPILTTIPLFTFVGYLMAESKTPERLVRAASAWVGWLPGGLAIVCVVSSAVFTLFTGGSGVTIIAVGGLLLPALRQKGYSEKFSLGLVTTGGSLGLLLPYALPLLVYAMVTSLDFQLVNKAVILPGLVVLALFVLYAVHIGIKENIPRTPFNLTEALASTWSFKWELGVFVLLVVGITMNMTDIDEAAGLVALYTLCIECFIYKDISIKKDLVRVAKSSMALAGAVILILAMANALTNYVVNQRIPDAVLTMMLHVGFDKTWHFLIIMNLFLLVLGMIMDGFSAILVAVPLILPFAAHFGLGPFHVAIMFILNLELAFSCPPLGLNLFISSFRFNRPVVSLYRIALPFVGLLGIALVAITFVPHLSNALVLGDIQGWRDRATREHRTPREAWRLECVQHDPSNPLPCSEDDKKNFPNGMMPAPAVAAGTVGATTVPATQAGKGAVHGDHGDNDDDDEDLKALILGKEGKDAGAPQTGSPAAADETEDDLKNIIKGSK
ncbi:MAG: TRAP transporter large permease [Polyangiaceae bacterium]|nr:TRAP transporter large permease [Polyangiaceae bacterium]